MAATAVAHANIALIKYWGKRHAGLNLPAVGSISLTLDLLQTKTTVQYDPALKTDYFELNGEPASSAASTRVSTFLDTVAGSSRRPRARVASINNFPAGAGLASSASAFAALALSASKAAGQTPDQQSLSRLARLGSGSAARSVYGGFVEMKRGDDESGRGDYAVPLYDENYWDIRLLIAVTSTRKKDVGSTQGMNRTAETSPFYESWVKEQPADLQAMRSALENKDFTTVGELSEHSCFKMHGLAMSSRPPLLYWNAATTEIIRAVWDLRKRGIAAYVTIDAGPQIKILCLPESVDAIKHRLADINGLQQLLVCKPGPGAALKLAQKINA